MSLFGIFKERRAKKCQDVSEYHQIILTVLLQLCLVSILGFILCCVTYIPDERSSMQFIVKVSLHTSLHALCIKKERGL